MLSIQRLSILPGPGGGHSCAAPLGYCGGRWVSLAQPRQLWNEDGIGAGRCSAPGSPIPALPLRPEYLRPPQAVFACPPGLSSGAPSSGKSSRTPICTPQSPSGSTQSLAPQFTHPSLCASGSPVPLHCEFLDQRPLQILPCAWAKREAWHTVSSNHFQRGICCADHILPGALGDRKRLLLSLRAKIHFFRSHISPWGGGFVDSPYSGGQGWGQGDLGYKERE